MVEVRRTDPAVRNGATPAEQRGGGGRVRAFTVMVTTE